MKNDIYYAIERKYRQNQIKAKPEVYAETIDGQRQTKDEWMAEIIAEGHHTKANETLEQYFNRMVQEQFLVKVDDD